MTDDLRELIQRCLAGEQAAMVDLVERYRQQVFRLCYRMLGQREDAEDTAQETFLRALRSLASFDLGRPFEPWLLAIAGNRCRTMLAARRNRPRTDSDLDSLLADDSPDPHAARTLAEEVQWALQRIRPEYREAFVLFHDHELSYEGIAAALKRPVGTIKTWVRRARQELSGLLQQREVVGATRHDL